MNPPKAYLELISTLCLELLLLDTSRPPKMGEIHGMDYYFDTRSKMLADIASGLYLEHGEFKGNIYGTRITTIIEHIEKGLQPVLIPHHQVIFYPH